MNNARDVQSFGFADTEKINLTPHDTLDGDLRLSWNIGGSTGGARLGSLQNLSGNDYYKVIMVRKSLLGKVVIE